MSATVKHGRRRGQSRGTPELSLETGNQRYRGDGMQLPNGTDLRQVTVLSKNDWERIQSQLNKRAIEEERMRKLAEERNMLHERSKDMVKNWSNTIAGQRQKKLQARTLREKKEEEERKLIDIEEAKIQAQQRKEAIDKAKTQQYYQTDRVKGFHAALLLTEVLKERDAQLEFKRLKEKKNDGQDEDWLNRARREYEEGIKEDQQKAAERIKNARDNAEFIKSQIRDHQRMSEREKEDLSTEGDSLKRLAAQFNMEKTRLEQIHKEETKQLMSDNLRQIKDVGKMKEINKLQEEEEDEECRIFAAAKRKMMRLRAEKEKELYMEKQKNLNLIREKLFAQMQQRIDDEGDRMVRADEEHENKRQKDENEKNAKRQKYLQEIAEHRNQHMREMEMKEAEDRRKMMEMLKIRQEADEVFRLNEQEKSLKRLEEARNLQDFHSKQIDDKQGQIVGGKKDQLAYDKANLDLVNVEEEQFQEYARRVIDHAQKGGRNTYPLRVAAKEGAGGGLGPTFPGKGSVRPSYMASDDSGVQMPNYQKDSTNDTKEYLSGSAKTNKRLGFVW